MSYPFRFGTNMYFLTDVPLDTTYTNTIYWHRESAQRQYFQGLVKHQILACSYQRIGARDVIRVPRCADDLYDCNYVMFANSAFGNKWFYAFITNVEYVNPETSFVDFEIDVMQTWHFDYQLKDSFVVREHSGTDEPGDNLVPDNFYFDELQYKFIEMFPQFMNPRQIVVEATFNRELQDSVGGMYGGIYSGLEYIVFGSQTDLDPWLLKVAEANKINGIVAIYMVQSSFIPQKDTNEPQKYIHGYQRMYTDLNGYIPRNKKMFTYPYYYLMVTDNEGKSNNYRFEWFGNAPGTDCQFQVSGTMGANTEVELVPMEYKGASLCYPERMLLTNFPLCSWVSDAYIAWLAQHRASILLTTGNAIANMASGIGGMAVAAEMGGIGADQAIGAFGKGFDQLAGHLAERWDVSTAANTAHTAGGGDINFANHNKGFSVYRCMPSAYWCNRLDKFWDVYGYPQNIVKYPNRSVREHWNYLKTSGVNLVGSVPAGDMRKIAMIYDKGITFWNDGDEIGNYQLDNTLDQSGFEQNPGPGAQSEGEGNESA